MGSVAYDVQSSSEGLGFQKKKKKKKKILHHSSHIRLIRWTQPVSRDIGEHN